MDHAATTIEFFERWGVSFDEMCAAFTDTFGPDCVWDQRPMARTTGPDQALRFLRLCRSTLRLATIDVETLSLAVNGDTVHTQRVDHLRRADGGIIASAPVAGVLTYGADGRLVEWKEYFDSASLGARSVFSGVSAGVEAGVGAVVRRIGRLNLG
jgi:limonene-1,2-epoxide hydrolase